MDGNHIVIKCSLGKEPHDIIEQALCDTGTTGFAFIDEAFARQHNFPKFDLGISRAVDVINGRPIPGGDITHLVKVPLRIGNHLEELPAFVTTLGHYKLVLAIPWMRQHNVTIDFAANSLDFKSEFCNHSCLTAPTKVTSTLPAHPDSRVSVHALSATSFRRILKNEKQKYGKIYAFSLPLYDIHQALYDKEPTEEDTLTTIPKDYHQFLPLFRKVDADKLPPHRPHDHNVNLKEGFTPPFGPLYSLSRPELEALRDWLQENLSKGFIRASSSPAGSPILFVKKGDGSLRLCVDYRVLNEGTIKNRYPLPLIKETLMRLSQAKWFSKLDVRGAYNLIRMKEGDEWKTAFRTRYGLYESLVMPFGLTNAPATFQNFINTALAPFLDTFAMAYLHDIHIYSNTLEEHKEHIRKILNELTKHGLYLKPKKCEFHRQHVKYLGLIIRVEGIQMEKVKVEAIQECPIPERLRNVRVFLGFANVYWHFIKGYSEVIRPMSLLTQKETKFQWGTNQQEAFAQLKKAFTSAPVLARFDDDRNAIVKTDAFNFVSTGVLSQYDDQGILHPVTFISKNHGPAECN